MDQMPSASKGFLSCFLMNLVYHFMWGVAAAVLYLLHYLVGLPKGFGLLALAVWVLRALVMALLVYWGNESSQEKDPEKPNKNPYSARNGDMTGGDPGSHRQ